MDRYKIGKHLVFITCIDFPDFSAFTKGFRWHLLNVANDSGKLKQSLGEFLESYAIGVITPGRLGELMKAGHQKIVKTYLHPALG